MWAIDEFHGTFTFRNSLYCGYNIWGTECIEDYWCAAHTVQNYFIDTLNLLIILRLDAKAFQILSFGNQSKTKIHRTNGR
jgi:hypothetical protein